MLCCKKNNNARDSRIRLIVKKKLSIFWICGPPGVGKSTLANLFAQSSNYRLIKCTQLVLDEEQKKGFRGHIIRDTCVKGRMEVPAEIMTQLVKEAVLSNIDCMGFIIDGFPLNLYEAKLFEKEICKVTIIVYVTIKMDTVIQRRLSHTRSSDFISKDHLEHSKQCEAINRQYRHRTIKIHTNLDPQQTCNLLLETLNDYWDYNFTLYK